MYASQGVVAVAVGVVVVVRNLPHHLQPNLQPPLLPTLLPTLLPPPLPSSPRSEHGIPVVPQGGNTGLAGGGVARHPGELTLSLRRMAAPPRVDADARVMYCEVGDMLCCAVLCCAVL
jgi:hypothetical protein